MLQLCVIVFGTGRHSAWLLAPAAKKKARARVVKNVLSKIRREHLGRFSREFRFHRSCS
jgi:hypothetical protein